MSQSIISRDIIQAGARAAFEAGQSRDSHNMNWHAAALVTWLDEYDRLALLAKFPFVTSKSLRISTPVLQSEPAEQADIDVAQLVANYRNLDDYGRRVARALIASLARLQGGAA